MKKEMNLSLLKDPMFVAQLMVAVSAFLPWGDLFAFSPNLFQAISLLGGMANLIYLAPVLGAFSVFLFFVGRVDVGRWVGMLNAIPAGAIPLLLFFTNGNLRAIATSGFYLCVAAAVMGPLVALLKPRESVEDLDEELA